MILNISRLAKSEFKTLLHHDLKISWRMILEGINQLKFRNI